MTSRLRPREVDKLKRWKESARKHGILGLRLGDLTENHKWSASRTPVEAALQYHIIYEETTDVEYSIEVLESADVVTQEDRALAKDLLATVSSATDLETLLRAFAWSEKNPGTPIEEFLKSDMHGSNLVGPYKHLWRPWLNLRPKGKDTPEHSDFTPSVVDAPKANRRTTGFANPDTSPDSVSFDRTPDNLSSPLQNVFLDLDLDPDSPSTRPQARAHQRPELPSPPIVTSYVDTEGSPAPTKGHPLAGRASSRVPSGSLTRTPSRRASLPISSAHLVRPPARNAGSQDPSTPAYSTGLSHLPRYAEALQPRGPRTSSFEVQASHFLGHYTQTLLAENLGLDSVHIFYFVPQE